MRTCRDCGESKPHQAFTAIKGTSWHYGRCKACRAARARAATTPRDFLTAQPQPGKSGPKPKGPPGLRICLECRQVKAADEFVKINNRKTARYGRCNVCRARRARQRYQSNAVEREKQKARVRKNRARRLTTAPE